MTSLRPPLASPPIFRAHPRRGQAGALLFMTLIVLVVLFMGSLALSRSFNATLFTAGNMAFKRDLTNQAERVLLQVMPYFQPGGAHYTTAARAASASASNYSALVLPANAVGIPLALLDDSLFAALGSAANDIVVSDQGITVRYLVERLCDASGDENSLSSTQCVQGARSRKIRGSHFLEGRVNAPAGGAGVVNAGTNIPLYRINVRVTGPRNTQSFYQYAFSL